MNFDIIIGNPPYNNTNDSQTKKNGKVGMVANFYKEFIHTSKRFMKDKTLVSFILPAGAFKGWVKEGFTINKARYNKLDVWGKSICTVCWYCSMDNNPLYQFSYSLQDKIFKQQYLGLEKAVSRNDGGIIPYNFYSKPYAITRAEHDALSNKNSYAAGTFKLKSTDINKQNVIILMKYLEKYLHKYLFSMYSTTKKLKVEWLEGKTEPITEQDIINYYGFTEEEVKLLK